MHSEAFYFVKACVPERPGAVLEIGSRNINGGVRRLFRNATEYVGLDICDGDEVDVVENAATYDPERLFDTVVSCEVLEHTPEWREIVANAGKLLRPGGTFILTCAGPGRRPHGAEGGAVGDEHYENISVEMLEAETSKWGVGTVRQVGGDTQAFVVKNM